MTLGLFRPPPLATHPEIFFALVGATGTDLDCVTAALKAELAIVGYRLEEPIKLSRLIYGLSDFAHLEDRDCTEDKRIRHHMDAGDRVREVFGHGSALAALAVAEVRRIRNSDEPIPSTAYVFKSLKHPEEANLLRQIYGHAITIISVYEEEGTRRRRIALKIEQTSGRSDGAEELANALIKRDQDGHTDQDKHSPQDRHHLSKYWQNVRKTFPMADFFLEAGPNLRGEVERLIQLIFKHPHISPTRDEYAMFMAQAAALRSADMSRQVGAVITDDEGEIVAVGCNEVPKPGGGVYWNGESPDWRDFRKGTDPNAIMGRAIIADTLKRLRDAKWLDEARANSSADELVAEARRDGHDLFEDARIGSLIEFGRVVHAEMNAIVYAARKGIAIGGRRLYCTTFPCHGCARHIIGAGIGHVTYIEPYPKSLAVELYPEAILLMGDRPVTFTPFSGVAPRRYLDWFAFGKRKEGSGYAKQWIPAEARPRIQNNNPHLFAEQGLLMTLKKALSALEPDVRSDE